MNKTVLITGASTGIGFELAKIFAQNGYYLILISQSKKRLDEALAKLKEQYPTTDALLFPCDLSKLDSAQRIYEFTKTKEIDVDILVNCAGIQVYGNFHEQDSSDILQLMHVNMYGPVALTKLFVNDMVKRKSGKILNVGSTGAFAPCALNAVYCASKAFILHFSEGISEELKASGVTVTTLCPGATNTNFAKRANIEDIKLFCRTMEPDKVAKIAYKALSKGEPLVVSGLNNKLLTFLIRFTPRKISVKVGKRMMAKM